MFTGIITDLGKVRSITKTGDTRFEFETSYDTSTIEIGASIACNGACMTVIETGPNWFAITASGESLSKTTMGSWKEGSAINFERAMKVGDELGDISFRGMWMVLRRSFPLHRKAIPIVLFLRRPPS